MIIRKSHDEIEAMGRAGVVVAETLRAVGEHVAPGVTTKELDDVAEEYIRGQGGVPTFKGYRGFPGSICASPNSMVVHGIPGPYRLERGDILSIDIGVVYDGWVADAARTFGVGEISPVAAKLLQVTEESLFRAVESAASPDGQVRAAAGWTHLVIGSERPPRTVDSVLSGFHDRNSSHLKLLETIAGPGLLQRSYVSAREHGYLRHEFGDVLLVLPTRD